MDPAVLELAKEIQTGIGRVAADPDAHLDLLDALIEGTSSDKRMELAQAILDELPVWTRPDLEALTVEELRAIARDSNVQPKGSSKAALVAAILGE